MEVSVHLGVSTHLHMIPKYQSMVGTDMNDHNGNLDSHQADGPIRLFESVKLDAMHISEST